MEFLNDAQVWTIAMKGMEMIIRVSGVNRRWPWDVVFVEGRHKSKEISESELATTLWRDEDSRLCVG